MRKAKEKTTLDGCGEAFLEEARSTLAGKSQKLRLGIVRRLAKCEPELAIPHLLPLLEDKNGPVQIAAAEALEQFKSSAASALPAVLHVLQEKRALPGTRAQLVKLLFWVVQDVGELAARLEELYEDPAPEVRAEAIRVLTSKSQITHDERLLPLQIKAMYDDALEVQRAAVSTTAENPSPELINGLGHVLEGGNPKASYSALHWLHALGEASANLIPRMRKCLYSEDEHLVEKAVRVLVAAGDESEELFNVAIKAFCSYPFSIPPPLGPRVYRHIMGSSEFPDHVRCSAGRLLVEAGEEPDEAWYVYLEAVSQRYLELYDTPASPGESESTGSESGQYTPPPARASALEILRAAKEQNPAPFTKGVTEAQLKKTESKLPHKLPNAWHDMFRFSSTLCTGAGDYEVHFKELVSLQKHLDEWLEIYEQERDPRWLAIGYTGGGDIYVLQVENEADPDSPVLLVDHETGEVDQRWDNAADFARQMIYGEGAAEV